MTELERALVLLGDELAFPPAPDVSVRVLARVAEAPPRRRRRALVLVVAALAVAIGAAFAVPQARTAILDFFGLRGATVQRVETLPVVPPRTAQALDLGQRARSPKSSRARSSRRHSAHPMRRTSRRSRTGAA